MRAVHLGWTWGCMITRSSLRLPQGYKYRTWWITESPSPCPRCSETLISGICRNVQCLQPCGHASRSPSANAHEPLCFFQVTPGASFLLQHISAGKHMSAGAAKPQAQYHFPLVFHFCPVVEISCLWRINRNCFQNNLSLWLLAMNGTDLSEPLRLAFYSLSLLFISLWVFFSSELIHQPPFWGSLYGKAHYFRGSTRWIRNIVIIK